MEAWMQEDFSPVAQDADGNDMYGYVCIVPQNQNEVDDLLEFLETHGVPFDLDEMDE